MVVFCKDATAGVHVGLHTIDRVGMDDVAIIVGRIGSVLVAATIQHDHVVLIEVGLTVPQRGCRVGIGRPIAIVANAFAGAL